MRTTVTIDDDLWAKAQELTGIEDRGSLVRMAFETLIMVQAGRRLAQLGGTQPGIWAPGRSRRLS